MTSARPSHPGHLRHRLVLEHPVFAADGGGGSQRSWQVVTSFWGALAPFSPRHDVDAEKPGSAVHFRVTCRYRTDIRPGQRLRSGSDVLTIDAAIDPDGQRRWLEILCREHQT